MTNWFLGIKTNNVVANEAIIDLQIFNRKKSGIIIISDSEDENHNENDNNSGSDGNIIISNSENNKNHDTENDNDDSEDKKYNIHKIIYVIEYKISLSLL